MSQKNNKMALKMAVLALVLGVGILAFMFFIPVSVTTSPEIASSSSDSGFPFVVFIPIFAGGFLPIFLAAQKKQAEQDALQANTPAKKLKNEELDMYSTIDRLVDDLDDAEFDYLKKRAHEEFGYLEDDNADRNQS